MAFLYYPYIFLTRLNFHTDLLICVWGSNNFSMKLYENISFILDFITQYLYLFYVTKMFLNYC